MFIKEKTAIFIQKALFDEIDRANLINELKFICSETNFL